MKPFLLHVSAVMLSLAGGIIVALAFPPWSQVWLIWVGFTPVLAGLILFPRRWIISLIQGAIFGGAFGGSVFYWLWTGGRSSEWASNVASLALVGAIWGLFVGLFVRLPPKKGDQKVSPILPGYGFNTAAWRKSLSHLQAALVTAAAWTVLEWTRGVVLPEWNAVGTVLQSNLPLLQIATVTGASGLSFVVVFANLIALTTVRRIILEPGRMTWASRFDVTATLGVIFLVAIAGFWWVQHEPAGDRKNIGLICPDTVDFNRLLELSKQESGKGIDLFVWRCVRFSPGDYARLGEASIGKTASLVTGTTVSENKALGGATIIIPGSIRNLLVIAHRDFFQPWGGSIGRTLSPFGFADASWVTLINWEAADPRLIRAALSKQIQAIIALVDPFPGGRGATEQLFENLRLWSASLGHPIIFASAKRFAAIVTPSGKIVAGGRDKSGSDVLVGAIEVPSPSFARRYTAMNNLVVSLHDVSPVTQTLCEEILIQLAPLGIRQTSLLIIPNRHRSAPLTEDSAFRRWLVQKVEAGHEPVLHGYFHQRQKRETDSFMARVTTEIYTAGEGEFFDLSAEQALIRAEKGLEDLAFLPRKIVGFVAPAWLLGANAEIGIRKAGFLYTTHLGGVRIFSSPPDIRSQSLVWSTRARWRALMSLAWNRSLAFRLAEAPLIRVGIHPPDLQHPAIWGQVRQLLVSLSRGRDCVSYEKFVEFFSGPPQAGRGTG